MIVSIYLFVHIFDYREMCSSYSYSIDEFMFMCSFIYFIV